MENPLASKLRIHSFSAHCTVLQTENSMKTISTIDPVFKKGDKRLPSNYRPISLTSIVMKIMERIIHYKLTSVLEKSGRLCESQFGFHKKQSTVSLLLSAFMTGANVWMIGALFTAFSWTLLRHSTLCLMRGYCLNWRPWVYLVCGWIPEL